jgi:hypothetical protein
MKEQNHQEVNMAKVLPDLSDVYSGLCMRGREITVVGFGFKGENR